MNVVVGALARRAGTVLAEGIANGLVTYARQHMRQAPEVLPAIGADGVTASCQIPRAKVANLLRMLGSTWHVGDVCDMLTELLGTADPELNRAHDISVSRWRDSDRPVSVIGSGASGTVFLMSDGSVGKVMSIGGKDRTALNSYQTPIEEFIYEVLATKDAYKAFKDTPEFSAPEILKYALIRPAGAHGAASMLGMVRMTQADGQPVRSFLRAKNITEASKARVLQAWAKAVAALHRADWVHGDIHSSNVMVNAKGKVTIIDWARSIRKTYRDEAMRTVRRQSPEEWDRLMLSDVANALRGIFRHGDIYKHAPIFLEAYMRHCPRPEIIADIDWVIRHHDEILQSNLKLIFKSFRDASQFWKQHRPKTTPASAESGADDVAFYTPPSQRYESLPPSSTTEGSKTSPTKRSSSKAASKRDSSKVASKAASAKRPRKRAAVQIRKRSSTHSATTPPAKRARKRTAGPTHRMVTRAAARRR